MLEDPRLSRNKVRVPRRDDYEKRPVLGATIHRAMFLSPPTNSSQSDTLQVKSPVLVNFSSKSKEENIDN